MNSLIKLTLLNLFMLAFMSQTIYADQNQIKEDTEWVKKVKYETRAVKRISASLAYQMLLAGKAIVISVDSPEYYKKMTSFLGTNNIPAENFKKGKIKKLPADKMVLLYCR